MAKQYTKEHEWIEMAGDVGTVGVSDYAQEQLGDVVFVELPAVGREVGQGEEAAVVESVKAASDIYAPIAGTVTEGNAALEENPALVNQDAEGEGWFFKLQLADPAQTADLMDRAAYDAYLESIA